MIKKRSLEVILEEYSEDEYLIGYAKMIGLIEMLTPLEINVVYCIAKEGGNKVKFGMEARSVLAKLKKIKPESISNALTKLTKQDVLVKHGNGVYSIQEDYLADNKIPIQCNLLLIKKEHG